MYGGLPSRAVEAGAGGPGLARISSALVTGATGMIGSFLVRRLLAQGSRVNVLVRDRTRFERIFGPELTGAVRLVTGELDVAGALEEAADGVEVVFHAAARVHSVQSNPREARAFFRDNIGGTEALLRCCTRNPLRRFVFFSTAAVYGNGVAGPLDEAMPCHPVGPYAESKYQAERRVAAFFGEKEGGAVILRLSLVYGEGERGNFLRMIRGIDQGRFLFVGDGQGRKSMTYVENVVEAALLAAVRPEGRGQVFNVADPSPYPLRLVAETVARELGVAIPRLRVPASLMTVCGGLLGAVGGVLHFRPPFTAADARRLTTNAVANVSKIQARLGFRAAIGLEEGVARTVRWYRAAGEGQTISSF